MRDYLSAAERLSIESEDIEDFYADELGDAAMAMRVLDLETELW